MLLHCCCAPCSGAIIEKLTSEGERPVLFFSNSNIVPRSEYDLRLAELKRYATEFGLDVVEDEYDHEAWLQAVQGLERERERGARCLQCFKFRLQRAARYAAAHGQQTVATTLASSRWKDLAQVAEAGNWSCAPEGVGFCDRNWRKGGLQERRNAIIREQNFYNQTFCGCEFSRKQEN